MNARSPTRKIAVFGGSGRTGMEIVRRALQEGIKVAVLVRDRRRLGDVEGLVEVVEGDVLDPLAVGRTVQEGTDAVLSALGTTKGDPRDFETRALKYIVAAMDASGVRRLVLLSSTAAEDPGDRPTAPQSMVLWLLRAFNRDVYEDSRSKASFVRGSGLDWTIVRASLLAGSPPKGSYRVGAMGKDTGLRIPRGDLAGFMLECATGGLHIHESPYISA